MRRHAQEAGRHLCVEDVSHLATKRAAQQRDVLASGVDHNLDLRIGQHAREWLGGKLALERIEYLDQLVAIAVGYRKLRSGTAMSDSGPRP